jgi:hypothetical protein
MLLTQWAQRWGIPQVALDELVAMTHADRQPPAVPDGATTEQGASKHLALQAAQAGDVLWRNNVGATKAKCPECGYQTAPVRYGIANDTPAMNKLTKSSDRIGIRRVVIQPEHVGHTIGQFTAREVKKPGWKYTGTEREQAQLRFIELVTSMGGDACFSTGMY